MKKRWNCLVCLCALVAFQYYLVYPIPSFIQFPNVGTGMNAHAYLFGAGPVFLEVDYEQDCQPNSSAIEYLIYGFNRVSRRTLVPVFDFWNELDLWSFNETHVNFWRNCSNDYNHIYVLYNNEESLLIGNSAVGGCAWDSSTILMSDPNSINLIQEANRLLHELGHLLGLFHPSSQPHCHPNDAEYCIMSPSSSDSELQFFCPYCLVQLSIPQLVLNNMLHWFLEVTDFESYEWRRMIRYQSRVLESVFVLVYFIIFCLTFVIAYRHRKDLTIFVDNK